MCWPSASSRSSRPSSMGTYARPTVLGDALETLAVGSRAGRPAVIGAGATDHFPTPVELASRGGTRRLPIGEFVTGNRTTLRAPEELVTGLFVPDAGATATSTFLKLGSRAYLVISIAMVAAVVARDAEGRMTSARVAV